MHVVRKAVNACPFKLLKRADGVNGEYSSERRIRKADDFSSVFRMRPQFRTEHFILYVRTTQLGYARLGIVVAKRFAPRAVTRNTVKRICREIFRNSVLPSCDCIIRLTRPINTRRESATGTYLKRELRSEVSKLMSMLCKRKSIKKH